MPGVTLRVMEDHSLMFQRLFVCGVSLFGTQNQQKSGLPSRCSARPNEQAENPCNSASPAHVQ